MNKNVGNPERLASILIGTLLLSPMFRKTKKTPAKNLGPRSFFGLGLLWRGLTGSCPLYNRFALTSCLSGSETPKNQTAESSIIINKPAKDVMKLLKKKKFFPEATSPNYDGAERLVGTINNLRWLVHFDDAAAPKQTKLSVIATRKSGDAGTSWLHAKLDKVLKNDLHHFKAEAETGEVATTAGQPRGHRTFIGKTFENIIHKLNEGAKPNGLEKSAPQGQFISSLS